MLKKIILPLGVVGAGAMLGIGKYHKEAFAWFQSSVTPQMNEILKQNKTELFDELNRRAASFGHHQYKVLEIGGGSGTNFQFVNTPVDWTVSEPNVKFAPYFNENVAEKGGDHKVTGIIEARGEDLGVFQSNSFDAVIITLVLCSVDKLEEALNEIKRVLKPGGSVFFIDHVGAKHGTRLRKFQDALNPTWGFLFDGCVINKDIEFFIRSTGFSDYNIKKGELQGIDLCKPLIYGYATK